MILKSLEFEIRWRLRELIQEHGAAVVMNTQAGQKLFRNLEAVEKSNAEKLAA
ncbi:MAG: hypothetical protein M0P73_20435 [Syntrophobacterales bacterium]|jgi:hypothetical protein|nr:hypothetical protein [Syntrophobacterales bacterium]